MFNNIYKNQNYQHFAIAILLGVFGALVNLFPIELAFNISLLIGNTAYIIAASLLRPSLTLLSALICVIPLYFQWGHPHGFLTFGLEAIFISILRNKGWYVLSADLFYWIIIGMPLTAFFIWSTVESPQNLIIFTTFKQTINAVLYTSLASILLLIFSDFLKKIKTTHPPLQKSLPKWLLYSFWSITTFLVISVSLVLSTDFGKRQRHLYERELEINNQYISHIGNRYLNEHKIAIKSIAIQLSKLSTSEDREQALLENHPLYPGFLTMLIASEDGEIQAASPPSLLKKINAKNITITDRPYFIRAMEDQRLFVSTVFLGRGFGSDPIVAISAPIYTAPKSNAPSGIVEGSLNLGKFGLFDSRKSNINNIKIIVTDNDNRIIYASTSLGFDKLSELKFDKSTYHPAENLITFQAGESEGQMFIYKQAYLNNHWKIYSLVEHSVVLKTTEDMYLVIFITLFVVLLFTILFSKQFSVHLNRPLVFVIEQISKAKNNSDFKEIPYDAATEIVALYQELKIGKQALLQNQEDLKQQVAIQTKELNQANNKLTKLANTDTLTTLYNRRYLEEHFSVVQSLQSRNNSYLMFAVIDLDFFKVINDSHGHLFGDYCLVEVAKILKQFFNRSADIVARFGGEEFIIVAPCKSIEAIQIRLEKLRLQVEKFSFKDREIGPIKVTVSIGVAFGDASYSTLQDNWFTMADDCLYKAKENGRNQVCVTQLIQNKES